MKQFSLLSSAMISAMLPLMCCWGPAVMTSLAGISGSFTWFSWIHPLRPYLFGVAFVSLGFSFYQAYKPNSTANEGCQHCQSANKTFFRSKIFTWVVALFVVFTFLLNYYPHLLLS